MQAPLASAAQDPDVVELSYGLEQHLITTFHNADRKGANVVIAIMDTGDRFFCDYCDDSLHVENIRSRSSVAMFQPVSDVCSVCGRQALI